MNKKMITTLSLVLGLLLAASAAFADIIAGNGYYTIKESLKKTTAHVASGEMDNFTFTGVLSLTANGKELYKEEAITKYDGDKSERTSYEKHGVGSESRLQIKSYNTKDKAVHIYYNTKEKKPHAVAYSYPNKDNVDKLIYDDPFKQEEIKDFETVIDAGVGNLKDALFAEETAEGKMYYANIENEQIPVFINALSSFLMKYSIFDEHQIKNYNLPDMRENISISNASGKAFENKDGILTEGIASITVTGNDKAGNLHEVIISISVSVTDIGTSSPEEPDLTGIETEYIEAGFKKTGIIFNEKYIGAYKADIVEVIDDKFVKTGEKTLVITEADGKKVKGTFKMQHFTDESKNMFIEFESFNPYENSNYKIQFYNDVPIKYMQNGEEKGGLLTNNYHGNDNEAAMLMLDLDIDFLDDGGWRHNIGIQYNMVRVME
ncbi:MAG: hypothetical protein J6L59_02060 [Clostridia bacterium]|nr:hypothetical protein [Clostridia bacterium]